MGDLPIAPDLTTGEPRCSAECPSFVPSPHSREYASRCLVDPIISISGPFVGTECRTYQRRAVHELVQLRARVAEIERKRARCAAAAKQWRWLSLTWRATVRQHHEQRCDRCKHQGSEYRCPDTREELGLDAWGSCSRFEEREGT